MFFPSLAFHSVLPFAFLPIIKAAAIESLNLPIVYQYFDIPCRSCDFASSAGNCIGAADKGG